LQVSPRSLLQKDQRPYPPSFFAPPPSSLCLTWSMGTKLVCKIQDGTSRTGMW
jgi:hypothetical protein